MVSKLGNIIIIIIKCMFNDTPTQTKHRLLGKLANM